MRGILIQRVRTLKVEAGEPLGNTADENLLDPGATEELGGLTTLSLSCRGEGEGGPTEEEVLLLPCPIPSVPWEASPWEASGWPDPTR